jgi:hypothetical protein
MHLSRRLKLVRLGAFSAGAVVLVSPVVALAGPTVTVRVEGEAATLLPPTSVTLNAPEPVSGCPANSVAAAINLAVGGNWDHGEVFGGGGFTDTILGETHAFEKESDTWGEWVNYKWGSGICADLLSEGDEVLMVADHEPPPFFAPTVLPLVVSEAPKTVEAGVPFSVKVSAIHTPAGAFAEPGQGTAEAAEGVTVAGAGASATTNVGGVATVTLASLGQVVLRATKAGDAPSAPVAICVHAGNDGRCGTTAPISTGPPRLERPVLAPPYTGPFALVARVGGLLDNHVYGRHAAPRLLGGTILSHSAVTAVSLELRRRNHGRCYAYDGTRERFRRARCGTGRAFKVSSGGVFSYLLPAALPAGRYVLDIAATDIAGNRVALSRGTSRIVFYVR